MLDDDEPASEQAKDTVAVRILPHFAHNDPAQQRRGLRKL